MRILKKLLALCGTILLLSFFVFLAFQIIPGDTAQAQLGTNATPEAVAALREELSLNDPLPVRFARFLGGALHGDFGKSSRYRMPVSELLGKMLPNTLVLAGLSLLLIIVISLPAGILCARWEGSFLDRFVSGTNQTLMAVPAFFLGILLSLVLGIVMNLFVPGRAVNVTEDFGQAVQYLIYPAIAIAIPKIAMTVRFFRNALISEREKDYVRTARSLGMSKSRAMIRYMVKNALISVVTFLGVIAAEVLAGSIVIEQVFGVNGIGRLLVASISNRDYNVVSAIVLYIGIAVVLVNLCVDVLYGLLDPRVRRNRA